MFFLYGFGWFYGRSAKWKSMENKFSLAFYHAINSVVLALTHAYKICPCRLHKQKIQAPSPPENKIKKSDCMCIKKCLLNAKLVIGAKTITDFLLIFFAFSSRSCRFVYVCVKKYSSSWKIFIQSSFYLFSMYFCVLVFFTFLVVVGSLVHSICLLI